MGKRIKDYVKYTKNELENYTKILDTCIKKVNKTIHLNFPSYGLGSLKNTLEHIIAEKKIGRYDHELNGIILDVRNLKVIGNLAALRFDDPTLHFNVQADCYVFSPKIGSIVRGLVKHISARQIGVIIYRVFNVSIRLSDYFEPCHVVLNSEVEFRIKNFDLENLMPYIEGELITTKPTVTLQNLERTHTYLNVSESESSNEEDVVDDDILKTKPTFKIPKTPRKNRNSSPIDSSDNEEMSPKSTGHLNSTVSPNNKPQNSNDKHNSETSSSSKTYTDENTTNEIESPKKKQSVSNVCNLKTEKVKKTKSPKKNKKRSESISSSSSDCMDTHSINATNQLSATNSDNDDATKNSSLSESESSMSATNSVKYVKLNPTTKSEHLKSKSYKKKRSPSIASNSDKFSINEPNIKLEKFSTSDFYNNDTSESDSQPKQTQPDKSLHINDSILLTKKKRKNTTDITEDNISILNSNNKNNSKKTKSKKTTPTKNNTKNFENEIQQIIDNAKLQKSNTDSSSESSCNIKVESLPTKNPRRNTLDSIDDELSAIINNIEKETENSPQKNIPELMLPKSKFQKIKISDSMSEINTNSKKSQMKKIKDVVISETENLNNKTKDRKHKKSNNSKHTEESLDPNLDCTSSSSKKSKKRVSFSDKLVKKFKLEADTEQQNDETLIDDSFSIPILSSTMIGNGKNSKKENVKKLLHF